MSIRYFRAALALLLLALALPALAQTTVTLQQGLNNYSGTTDTRLGNGGTQEGSAVSYALIAETSTSLAIRFAIFQSEGGPVPNGATITSATLSLYKFWGPVTGDSTFKASRFLKSWNEAQATWTLAATGTPWTSAGAQSAGSDYRSTPDGQGTVSTDIDQWLNIDVTPGVQAFSTGTPNYGWKVAYVSGGDTSKPKEFYSRDNTQFPTSRPKLTVTYTTAPPPSGTPVTLQQGLNSYAGTTDTRIGNGGTNEGAAVSYALIAETSTSLAIRFAIFQSEGGPVPNGATITSATLSLYKFWGPVTGDSTFKASRFLKSWNEMQATWSVAATGTPWTSAGAQSAGSDYLATPDGQATVSTDVNQWLNIDVTPGVQAFGAGTPNYGWKVAYVGGGDTSKPKEFYSRDNTQFPTLRPKLTITYATGGGTATAPTAQLTASPTTGTAPLGVDFDASATTDGGSPITSLRLQFGDGTPDAIWADKNVHQPHTYSAAGTYTATLTATNAVGTSAPRTQTITVTQPGGSAPTASFTWSQRAGTTIVDFNASGSADNGSPITSLNIAFGDGQQAVWSDKNTIQSHTYAAPGPYHVTLTATNVNGTSAPSEQDIQVSDPTGIPPSLPQEGRAVSTFHSIGLYWAPAGTDVPLSGKGVPVQYRKAAESTWRRGYDMVYDTRAFTVDGAALEPARGSIVHLAPNTAYVVQFGKYDASNNVTWVKERTASTWNEQFPEAPTEQLAATITNGSANAPALQVSTGGTPSAYRVLSGAQNGTRITANTSNSNSFGIRVSASYVIIRNVTVVGGADAIRIDDGVHDVVIENSDISGYGRPSSGRTHPDFGYQIGANEDAGIRTAPGASATAHRGIRRIVIQRNRIHDPAYGANLEPYGRDGPKHIDMTDTGGNHVIRYNELYTTNGDIAHYVQDGISGSTNDSQQGAPGQDSDIYMNRIQHVGDDCIEAEGGGLNVRVWKNYTDMCAVGIGSTAVNIGPAYIWRNVHNRARKNYSVALDSDDRLQAFKSGTFSGSGGRRHLFHNSVMQLVDPSFTRRLGHGGGVAGNTGQPVTNTVSRNNIYHNWTSGSPYSQISTSSNDFDYDMAESYGGAPAYAHPLLGAPTYKAGHGPSAFNAGTYQLSPGTLGYDQGARLFNFNDDVPAPHQFQGAAPDAGAHEDLTPNMVFGVNGSGS